MGGMSGGFIPQFGNAVGRASLGMMPTGNTALPATPAHLMGSQAANGMANAVGQGGTGFWSAASPGQMAGAAGLNAQGSNAPGAAQRATQLAQAIRARAGQVQA